MAFAEHVWGEGGTECLSSDLARMMQQHQLIRILLQLSHRKYWRNVSDFLLKNMNKCNVISRLCKFLSSFMKQAVRDRVDVFPVKLQSIYLIL